MTSKASPIIKRSVLAIPVDENEESTAEADPVTTVEITPPSESGSLSERDMPEPQPEASKAPGSLFFTNQPAEESSTTEPTEPARDLSLSAELETSAEPAAIAEELILPREGTGESLSVDLSSFEIQITLASEDPKAEIANWLIQLDNVFHQTEEGKSWVVDVSQVTTLPVKLIGALYRYKEQLMEQDGVLLLVLGDQSRLPQELLAKLQEQFSCSS